MIKPVVGSGNVMQQRGRLGAYKQDLLAHRDGTGFRQGANTVDMSPPLVFFPDPTVQGTLEKIETFLLNDNAFVSIGDGINSFGTFNVGDAGYPTIESCFAGAMATLRISFRGGIIQIKAGQYDFQNTVILDTGVSVIGELGGAILNATTANPIFKISESEAETVRVAPLVTADGSKQTKLYNLTFFDALGDANPYLNLSTIISCERGSNLNIEQCSVFGKIGSVGAPPPTTRYFVSYDTGTTSSLNSILSIEDCQVSAVQQVVDFDVEVARDNKLNIRNNRFWVSGRLGVPLTSQTTAAVTFRACDANLSHNQIWFGLNLASLQVVKTAFSCYDRGSVTRNIVVIGNQGHYYDDTLADDNNRLLSEDNEGLSFTRAAISGNTMGGASDSNSWYIVVGDGENSVGDINGRLAIQNIVSYFYKMNVGAEHGGIVIYVKPGDYTINNKAVFAPPASATATGLPLALIGISDNGNLPTINFNMAGLTLNGQEVMFSHHIENIHFNGVSSNYYKVMVRNEFANPDTRKAFFRNVIIKNCTFDNCSIGFIPAASSVVVNERMKNEVLIENCQFANSPVIPNMAAPEDMFAISCNNKNGKIDINHCQTIAGEWRGQFFEFDSSSSIDVASNCELYIDKCIMASVNVSGSYSSKIQSIRSLFFTNNIVDLASVPFGVSANGLRVSFSTDANFETLCNITNNYFIGNNSTVRNSAIIADGAEKVDISKNTFKGFHWCITNGIRYFGTTQTLQALSYNIKENRVIADSRSYGFYVAEASHGGLTNVLTGEINVSDNTLDYSVQGTSFSAFPDVDRMYAPIAISVKSPVATGTDDIQVNVNNNKITKFNGTLSTLTETECCICILGATASNINNNDISFRTISASGEFDAIYVSNNGIISPAVSNTRSTTSIQGNKIKSDLSTVVNASFVFVRNMGMANITDNMFRKALGQNMLYNVKAYNEGDLSGNPYFLCIDGIISNNIFDAFSVNGMKLKDSAFPLNTVKLTVGANKNLSVEDEIDCTHFKVYGYNRIAGSANGTEKATLMWRDNSIVSTSPSDKQVHIINDVAIGYGIADSAWDIPDGLYWTNATLGLGNSPSLPNTLLDYATANAENRHQVIVPIKIPDFCRLDNITIPIYARNQSGSPQTFVAGASAILGNHVSTLFPRKYELSTAASFSSTSLLIGDGSNGTITLDSPLADFTDRLKGTTDQTPLPTGLELYVVISLQISSEYEPVDNFYFGIPYVRVTYSY